MVKQVFKSLKKKGITKEEFFQYIKKYIIIIKNFSQTKFYKDYDEKI